VELCLNLNDWHRSKLLKNGGLRREFGTERDRERVRKRWERERDNSKTADKIALNLCAAP